MNTLLYLSQLPWIEPLGWTLIHFLWQGALIGFGAWLGLRAMHRQSPEVRYQMACGAMLTGVVALLVTFTVLAKPFRPLPPPARLLTNAPVAVPSASAVDERGTNSRPATAGKTSAIRTPSAPPAFRDDPLPSRLAILGKAAAQWAAQLWFVGAAFLALRLCLAWCRIQLWRFQTTPVLAAPILDSFARLARELGLGRRVRLLLCDMAPSPMTLGWIKPVILLPARIVTGLSPEEIEAILAHELAHIRRHDYLVNLLQSAVEVVLFYHPVIWWLSREIRETREECCDAIAARACADPIRVARALSSLAELQDPPQPALAARAGSLFQRVARLLGRAQPEPILTGTNAAWTLTLGCLVLVALGIVHSARLLAESADEVGGTKPAPHGLVLDEHGAPATQARILLYHAVNSWGLGNMVVEEVRSDAAGRFLFQTPLTFAVPHGTDYTDHYLLLAVQDGQAPAWAQIVGAGPAPQDLTLHLTHPVSQSYEVVDRDGRPVAGATVWLRYAGRAENNQPGFHDSLIVPEDCGISHAVTDESGHATLTNLPDTDRDVAASKAGFEDCLSCTTPRAGSPRFTLLPEAVLAGRVTDPLGQPVAGAKVWLYPKFGWHQYFLGRTDENGFYRIGKIWSTGTKPDWGKYDVGLEHPRFTAVKREVAFRSGQTISDFHIAAVAGTEILGRVLDPQTRQPAPGARLQIDSPSGRQTVTANSRGEFHTRVAAGPINLFFFQPPGGTYIFNSRQNFTQLHAFGAQLPVTFLLPGTPGKLGTVHGRAVGPEGKPIAHGRLWVVVPGGFLEHAGWGGNSWSGGVTTSDGSFDLQGIPVGQRLRILAESADKKLATLWSGQIKEERTELGDPLQLQAATTREVLIAGLDGQPRANLAVEVAALVEGESLHEQNFQTDRDGVLRIPGVLPGLQYRLAEKNSRSAISVIELADAGDRRKVTLADRFLIRFQGVDGAVLPIKSFKDFRIWIMSDGERVQWTNGSLEILEHTGAEAVVPRNTLVLGKPGDRIEFVIETEGGALAKAEGFVPENGSNLIVAKAKEPLGTPDVLPDASIPPVPPDQIVGRVLDPDGHPLPGATITLSEFYHGRERPAFTTDADGIFHIPHAREHWIPYATVFHEGFAPLFVTDFSTGQGCKVALQNSTRLRGVIGGGDGGEVALLLEKMKSTKRPDLGYWVRDIQYRTTIAAGGTYDIPMEPGTYRFTAASADGRFARGEVVVAANQATALPAVLQRGHDVTLQLVDWQTGQPVEGIEISIYELQADGAFGPREKSTRTSDKDGLARWENLMPGDTEFEAPLMSYTSPGHPQHSFVRWWRQDEPVKSRRLDAAKKPLTTGDGIDSIHVDVTAGLPPIRILMEAGVEIAGTVTGPEGAPMKGVNVGVVPHVGRNSTLTGDSRFIFQADEQGQFHGSIPAGNGVTYHLCAFYWPEHEAPAANAVSEPFDSKPRNTLNFQLRMNKGSWVTGRVLDAGGQPAPGVKVFSMAADELDLAYAHRIATTREAGTFRLGPLRPGEYDIAAGAGNGVPLQEIPGAKSKHLEITDDREKDLGVIMLPTKLDPSR